MSISARRTRTRYERRAEARQSRARAHRDRIQRSLQRQYEAPKVPVAAKRTLVAAAFVLSLPVGVALAWPTVDTAVRWWAAEPTRIESIAVVGNRRLAPEGIASSTGVARGETFDEIDLAEVEARLVLHPWIRSASAARLPIGRLIIQIVEREPVLALSTGANAPWLLVEADGTPFVSADADQVGDLPRLRGTRPQVLDESDTQLAEAVRLYSQIDSLELSSLAGPLELHLPIEGDAEGWRLDLSEPEARAVLGVGEAEDGLRRLAQLLDSELEEANTASRIDLRFSGRAVLSADSTSD